MSLPTSEDPKLWLALLYEISKTPTGQITPAEATNRLKQYFPAMTPADLAATVKSGDNEWYNRLCWTRERLAQRSLVSRKPRGIWTITDAGRQFVAKHWQGPTADYSHVLWPGTVAAASQPHTSNGDSGRKPPPTRQPTPIQAEPSVPPGQPVVLPDQVQQLCQRLTQCQRASQHPDQFEDALKDAFEFLGFEVKRFGLRGDTDLLITAPLGPDRYQAIVDAKTSGTGRLGPQQINWPALQQHQQKHLADYAMVVAEDFSDGNVQKFAQQFTVVLLRTSKLIELLGLHAKTAFSLVDLKKLFLTSGVDDAGLRSLQALGEAQLRQWRLFFEVLAEVEEQIRYAPTALAIRPDVIYASLLKGAITRQLPSAQMPSGEEVAGALRFLANRAIGALVEVPGTTDTYRLTMTIPTVRRRLMQLGRVFEQAASAASGQLAGGAKTASPVSSS